MGGFFYAQRNMQIPIAPKKRRMKSAPKTVEYVDLDDGILFLDYHEKRKILDTLEYYDRCIKREEMDYY